MYNLLYNRPYGNIFSTDIAHGNHKDNDMLLNDNVMEQENTCDFILPQREKHRIFDSKDLFPFEVRWKKSHQKNDGNPTMANPSPSTDLSSPPMDNEENDAPPEVRYVRSLFSDFQEFVEHIGWLKISYIYTFIMRN